MEKSQKMDDLGVPPGTPMTLESCKWVFHRKNQRPGQNGKINPTEIDQDSGKIDSYIYIYRDYSIFSEIAVRTNVICFEFGREQWIRTG